MHAFQRMACRGLLLAMAAIVCCGAAGDDRYGIFVVQPDGTGLRKVAEIPDCDYYGCPRWSHDGMQIAFDTRKGKNQAEKKIYLVDADGTNLREFGGQVNCDWSPDDKQIVYSVYDGDEKSGIYVRNTDGTGREFLTDGASPRWNADGTKIAFTDWATLKWFDVASGEVGELIDVKLDQYPFHFDWSRDGRYLAWIGRKIGTRRALYILDTQNPDAELKPRWRTDDYFPGFVSWSPDGKQVAVNADHTIQILEVAGDGPARRVPNLKERAYEPHWSPDGKWLVFARRAVWRP